MMRKLKDPKFFVDNLWYSMIVAFPLSAERMTLFLLLFRCPQPNSNEDTVRHSIISEHPRYHLSSMRPTEYVS